MLDSHITIEELLEAKEGERTQLKKPKVVLSLLKQLNAVVPYQIVEVEDWY